MSRLFVRAPLAIAALAALALSAAACGTGASAATSGAHGWPPSPRGTWGVEPKIVVPAAAPPKHLVTEDLITGTGAPARPGDTVTVQYVGVSYTTKKIFDASWSRHQPFSFALGEGQVIKGWDEGVAGMRVGGRRELIIPPSLAYGSQVPGPGIVANDTLIFIVDLLKVTSGS